MTGDIIGIAVVILFCAGLSVCFYWARTSENNQKPTTKNKTNE